MITDEYGKLKEAPSRIDGETLANFIANLPARHETVEETAVRLSRRGDSAEGFKAMNDRAMPLPFMGSVETSRAPDR